MSHLGSMKNLSMASPVRNITQQEENMTDYDTYNISGTDYDYDGSILNSLDIFSLVIHYVVFLLGTTGNGLVIFFTVFRIPRTINIVWILNLAIADFIFSFFLLFRIVWISLNRRWPFGRFMCMIENGIFYLNLYASLFLITVMSIDRCISVVFPVWSRNCRTRRLASIVAAVVWILAFIFSLPFFMYKDTDEYDGYVICIATFSESEKADYQARIISRFIVGFLIPFAFILSCYTIIFLRMRRNHRLTLSKPLKVFAAIISAFFICCFPFPVISLLEFYAHYNQDFSLGITIFYLYSLSYNLVLMNSCINPVLYFFIGRDFKEVCQHSIRSIFEKAFLE